MLDEPPHSQPRGAVYAVVMMKALIDPGFREQFRLKKAEVAQSLGLIPAPHDLQLLNQPWKQQRRLWQSIAVPAQWRQTFLGLSGPDMLQLLLSTRRLHPAQAFEILVKKAAVDPAFKTSLLNDLPAAAASIGLHIDAQAPIFRGATPRMLAVLIQNVRVDQAQRQALLSGEIDAIAAALTGGKLEEITPPQDPHDGYQTLLLKANLDSDFRSQLLAQPAAAATLIGLELTEAEREQLASVKRGDLERQIWSAFPAQPLQGLLKGNDGPAMKRAVEQERLAREAPPLPSGVADPFRRDLDVEQVTCTGIRPDLEHERPSRGIRPDRLPAPTGIRPDRPNTPGPSELHLYEQAAQRRRGRGVLLVLIVLAALAAAGWFYLRH